MAQFRTTADILDLALNMAGETTSGTSSYETQALQYLNRVHFTLIAGGTIPIGKDSTVEIDEVWPWAKSKGPLIIELQPKYETGTVTLTLGSEAGTFSSAPAASLQGYHLRIQGRDEVMKIAQHTAGATAFEIDAAYTETTGSGLSFTAMKLDYILTPNYITINTANNKIEFQETAGTTLTGTLTAGVYTPDDLISHVATVMNSTGGTPVYTGSYNSVTRKYTIASDRGGGAVFVLVGTGTNAAYSVHKTLGFDDENTTNAASVTSTYVRGGLCRLIEPFRLHRGNGSPVFGLDSESFHRDYPLSKIGEGNPDRFCVICENQDGIITVRFNAYPEDKTRVEIEHVAVPRDLKDNSSSVPLVPRKWVDVLEDATAFYIMFMKNDDKAQTMAQLLQGKLKAMIAQHRGSLARAGEDFGRIIPRRDLLRRQRGPIFGDPY